MNILAVVAHPDDEALGCAGTLAKEAAEGNDVHVLIMAEGAESRGGDQQEYKRQLHAASEKVREILGVQSYSFVDFPDNAMDAVLMLKLAKCVEEHVARLKPEVIYTHWSGDLNIDHRRTFEAVMTACRPQPGHPVKEIYSFEVPSATGWLEKCFQPNVYVDLLGFWDAKLKALQHYDGEMRPSPHARSYDGATALARYRGNMVGLKLAEAFELIRMVVR
jgi:LmbE family N-acetylglucosaminyl deacetylase